MSKLEIRVVRARPSSEPLPLPRYQSADAAGLDLQADLQESVTLAPFERRAIPTGLCLEIPSGHEAQIRSRSGLSLKHGVVCLNSPGTIDADYRGEVQVILANLSQEPFTLHRGDRIAQLVVASVVQAELLEVEVLSDSERGPNGFGSTGR